MFEWKEHERTKKLLSELGEGRACALADLLSAARRSPDPDVRAHVVALDNIEEFLSLLRCDDLSMERDDDEHT